VGAYNMSVKFDETLIMHIKHIDEQHRHLIDLINELEIQMKTSRTFYLIERILDELKKYAGYHFSAEEELFKKYKYPVAGEHIIEHRQFIDIINMFYDEYKNGKESKIILLRGIYSFLYEWINNHMRIFDKQYSKYLRDRGLE
jgi:hemerythrin-like metal-binding protein